MAPLTSAARRAGCLALVAALASSLACGRGAAPVPVEDAAPPARPAPPPAGVLASPPPLDLVRELGRCDVSYRGPVLDLGASSEDGRLDWSLGGDTRDATVEHDGATWLAVTSRVLTAHLWLDEPAAVSVAARLKGGAARSAQVSVDGRLVGQWGLTRGALRTATTRPTPSPLAAGTHVVQLKLAAPARTPPNEPLVELDWVRLAVPDESPGTWAAPTMREIVADAALGGVPHRSVSLRPGARVRCPVPLGASARLRTSVGWAGPGEGQAELRLVRDGESPVQIASARVLGGDRATWTPIDVALDPWVGHVVGVELFASGTASGRLLFGDPQIVAREERAEAPRPARLVVLLVMDGLDPTHWPPAVPDLALPAFAALAHGATVFERHRAPTTLVSGAMASLVTGAPPRAHGVEDLGARLPAGRTTIGRAARDGSVQTAMFTGVPTTGAAFAFDRGWDTFSARSPVEGVASTAPITEATEWIAARLKDRRARGLVLIHARGGHPPWHVLPRDLAELPPSDYTGPVEPRRAAQVLARARGKSARFKLADADRVRMGGLYDVALAGHDRAFSELIATLRKLDLDAEAMIVVTGDVSTDLAQRVPFGDGEDLAERLLEVPLWIRFPGGAFAGAKVQAPTTTVDLARTALLALGLSVPDGFAGQDLRVLAAGLAGPVPPPTYATLGPRWSARWGSLSLGGLDGRAPTLCNLGADPTCTKDASDAQPFARHALFRFAWEADRAGRAAARGPREPVTLDAATSAALMVWGE